MANGSSAILAIDPGSTESAVVIWDRPTILLAEKLPNRDVVAGILRQWRRVAADCYIEMIGHYGTGMPAGADVFDTCVWIGEFRGAWRQATGKDAILVKRVPVKVHHCRSARAKDSNVREALICKYGRKGTKSAPGVTYGLSGDTWQAFALATYVTELADIGVAA